MFAILETGSKQYKVETGDILEVELLDKNKIMEDNTIDFDSILLLKDEKVHIGQPFVEKALVRAKVLGEIKAPKVIIFKKKAKKQYRKTRGHRQQLHRIQIEQIGIGDEIQPRTARAKEIVEPTGKIKTTAAPKIDAAIETKPEPAAKPKIEAVKETKPKPAAKPKIETVKETKPKAAAKAEETKSTAAPKTKTAAKPKTTKKVETKETE